MFDLDEGLTFRDKKEPELFKTQTFSEFFLKKQKEIPDFLESMLCWQGFRTGYCRWKALSFIHPFGGKDDYLPIHSQFVLKAPRLQTSDWRCHPDLEPLCSAVVGFEEVWFTYPGKHEVKNLLETSVVEISRRLSDFIKIEVIFSIQHFFLGQNPYMGHRSRIGYIDVDGNIKELMKTYWP